jgi:prevent-host-death family protein
MPKIVRRGSQQARNQLPALIEAAEGGQATIITRRGRPVAALVPVDAVASAKQPKGLLPLEGSGKGFWGRSSARTLRGLRDEWGH